MTGIEKVAEALYKFAQERLGFDKPANVVFESHGDRAVDIFSPTANYNPQTKTIKIFVDHRHPKDILRSMAHELVHHAQCCEGAFDGPMDTSPGYAQKDNRMRDLERDAYFWGNGILFRDWEDNHKSKRSWNLMNENKRMSLDEQKLRQKIRRIIREGWWPEWLGGEHAAAESAREEADVAAAAFGFDPNPARGERQRRLEEPRDEPVRAPQQHFGDPADLSLDIPQTDAQGNVIRPDVREQKLRQKIRRMIGEVVTPPTTTPPTTTPETPDTTFPGSSPPTDDTEPDTPPARPTTTIPTPPTTPPTPRTTVTFKRDDKKGLKEQETMAQQIARDDLLDEPPQMHQQARDLMGGPHAQARQHAASMGHNIDDEGSLTPMKKNPTSTPAPEDAVTSLPEGKGHGLEEACPDGEELEEQSRGLNPYDRSEKAKLQRRRDRQDWSQPEGPLTDDEPGDPPGSESSLDEEKPLKEWYNDTLHEALLKKFKIKK